MARPREFDSETVLDAAMNCFWSRGYEATSMLDLATEMGITGSSLYNAFGNKRSLFCSALGHYAQTVTTARLARLEATLAPKQAIVTLLTNLVEHSLNDHDRRGCFLVNSALEVAPHDAEIGAEIARRFGEIEAFFVRTITAAQADGTVPPERNTQDTARLLLSVMMGIRVMARSNPDRGLLEGVARSALTVLDWPQAAKGKTRKRPPTRPRAMQ